LKKAQAAAAAKKAAAEGKTVEEEKEEEKKPEEVESEEEVDEEMEPEPTMTEAPKVSLTAEEKAVKFFPHAVKDIASQTFNASFTKFSLPTDDEFDLVRYTWAKEKEAAAYTKSWILGRKLTTRVEDIAPSAAFKQKSVQWQQAFAQWRGKQNEYKASVAKKAAEKVAKAQKKAAAERMAKFQAEKKAKEEEAKAKAIAEGKEVKEDEKKEEEKAPVVVEEEEEEEPEPEFDFDGVDVFGVEDVCDLGNKVPLFRDFQAEDYAMMNLRVELHLMAHSFSTDCDDPDRTGIHVDHLAFYYQKYFGKTLNVNAFGIKTTAELVALVEDTISVKESIMQSVIPSDLESNVVFAKITEACRRHRHLLVAMGDESAKLKISLQGHQQEQGQGGNHHQQQGQKRDWQGGNKGGGGKGGWGGGGGWNKW